MNTLQNAFSNDKNITIAKLSAYIIEVLEIKVTAAAMTKKSKEPIVGAVYNPEAINFDAVTKYLESKKVIVDDISWPAVAAMTASEKLVEMTLVVGDTFKLKYKPYSTQIWQLVYKTATHVCIQNNESTEPKVLANKTFVEGCRPYAINLHSMAEDTAMRMTEEDHAAV